MAVGQVAPLDASTSTASGGTVAAPVARGVSIGRYIVTDLIGVGAMGEVHAAYDPELDRKVAIKLLRSERDDEQLRERLVREAKSMARLSHDNVVPVYDAGTHGDRFFVAMALVQGQTLTGWLRETPRPWREVLAKFGDAGRGLAAAHAVGVVHRDFKPDNVLVDVDGRVRVADFGLARVGAPEGASGVVPDLSRLPASSVTIAGTLIGTPAFMAPEVLAGEPATEASDQFSFCVALYRGLYGERPFAGDTIEALRRAIASETVSPPARGARVPGWLRRVLIRGMRRHPGHRYPSMTALLRELARDPWRRWRIAAASVLVPALIALGVLALGRGGAPPVTCGAAASELAAVWDQPRRAAVRAALLADGAPHAPAVADAVARIIDGFGARWVAARTESCQATHQRATQSAELFDRRAQCLDRQLRQLDSLASVLAKPAPRLLDTAVKAAEALPPVEACSGSAQIAERITAPPDEAAAKQAEALRAQIDEAAALVHTARYDEAGVAIDRIVAAASALAYMPVEAEARWLLARLEEQRRDLPEAVADMQRAFRMAVAAGDERTAAEALARASFVTGVLLERRDEGGELARVAGAIATRIDDTRTALLVEYTEGIFAFEAGKLDVARERFEHVLAERRRIYAGDHSDIAHSLNTVGRIHKALGNFEAARRAYEEALAIQGRLQGPEHPDLSVVVNNLGVLVFEDLADYDGARPLLERALDLKAKRRKDGAEVGGGLTNLAQVIARQGDYRQALDKARQGLALMVPEWGEEHALTAHGHRVLGDLLWELGRIDEAEREYARSLASRRAMESPEDALELVLLVGRCRAALGDADAARQALDEAATRWAVETDPRRQRYAASLACQVLLEIGPAEAARTRCEEARAAVEATPTATAPERAAARLYAGVALLGVGRGAEATLRLGEALASLEARTGDVTLRAEARRALARALAASDPEQATALRSRARDELISALGPDAPRIARMMPPTP